MPLLNYTTKVPVTRTVGHIQGLLVEAGARSIIAEYDDVGNITGLSFAVQGPMGLQAYTLPVRSERVLAVLLRDIALLRTEMVTELGLNPVLQEGDTEPADPRANGRRSNSLRAVPRTSTGIACTGIDMREGSAPG